jgi:hypothetical protein
VDSSELEGLHAKLRIIGLLMCVIVPAASVILIWTVIQPAESEGTVEAFDWTFIWILTGMAVVEPIVGYFVRKRLLDVDAILTRCGNDARNVGQAIFAAHMVGFAFALSPALFGLVIQLVAHNALLATVLICISPLAFLFYRPTEATVDDLAREVSAKLAR